MNRKQEDATNIENKCASKIKICDCTGDDITIAVTEFYNGSNDVGGTATVVAVGLGVEFLEDGLVSSIVDVG